MNKKEQDALSSEDMRNLSPLAEALPKRADSHPLARGAERGGSSRGEERGNVLEGRYDDLESGGAMQGLLGTLFRHKLFTVLGVLALIVLGVSIARFAVSPGISVSERERVQAEKEVTELVAKVGKHIVLPEDEIPLVATVVDAEALQSEQPFYTGVQNGDRLLIYSNRLQAILYSPERNLLLNVGPVQIAQSQENSMDSLQRPIIQPSSVVPIEGSQTQADVVRTTNVSELTIDVRNGSGEDGAASSLGAELNADALYGVISTTDAASDTHPKTLVVDQTDGDKDTPVSSLAERLSATVVTAIPPGEAASTADVIVIIGREE